MRRICRYGILVIFVFCLYLARYPYKDYFPVDIFLRLDPLLAASAMLSGRIFIPDLMISLITLLSAVLLGRAFCGWFCPMGTTIDLFESILYRRRKKAKNQEEGRRYRGLKYIILVLVLFSALLGVSLSPLIDPVPLLTRIYTIVLYPFLIFLSNLGLDFIRPLSERLDISSLKYLSLEQPAFASNIITLIIFLAIIALSRIETRFFCRNLCPLGALLGICSRYNIWQKRVDEKCTDCEKCFKECPTGAVEFTTWRDLEAECIKCLICRDTCPAEAISYPVGAPRRASLPGVDLERRKVILAGSGGLVLAMAGRTGAAIRTRDDMIIRPPGALPETGFLATCARCAECVKACPTGTLQPDGLTRGIMGIWAPRHAMRLAACEQECNVCGQVCPTHAIRDLPLEDKKFARIGTARIIENKCLAWADDKACLVCDEVCPYNAIIFRAQRKGRHPEVVESRCNGCGWCEHVCPIEGEAAIVVAPKGEIRLSEGSYYNEAVLRGINLSAPKDELLHHLEGGEGKGGRRDEGGGKGRRGGRRGGSGGKGDKEEDFEDILDFSFE